MWIGLPGYFCLAAGQWLWWPGWAYSFIILLPMTIFGLWARSHSPDLLARRAEGHEPLREQRRIMVFVSTASLALYFAPALEQHHVLPSMPLPAALVVLGLAGVLTGYLGVLGVMVANRWAGRTIRTWEDQKIVTTGPYALVRHPMYAAFVVVLLSTPPALESLWGLIPAGLLIPLLMMRIMSEERELARSFPEYAAYQNAVPFRLFPGLW